MSWCVGRGSGHAVESMQLEGKVCRSRPGSRLAGAKNNVTIHLALQARTNTNTRMTGQYGLGSSPQLKGQHQSANGQSRN